MECARVCNGFAETKEGESAAVRKAVLEFFVVGFVEGFEGSVKLLRIVGINRIGGSCGRDLEKGATGGGGKIESSIDSLEGCGC